MFGLAAIAKWAKSRLGYAHVLILLVLVLIFGVPTKTAFGQIDATLTGAFSDAERAAIFRGVTYWNDVLIALNPQYSSEVTFVPNPDGTAVSWDSGQNLVRMGSQRTNWITDRNTQIRALNFADLTSPHYEIAAIHGIARVKGFSSSVLPNLDTTFFWDGNTTPPYGNTAHGAMFSYTPVDISFTRPFFSELELTILRDEVGHEIDISRFFGLTIFERSTDVIRVDNPDGYDLDGMYGVGLHLVAGIDNITYETNNPYPTYYPGSNNNTVILETDIISRGYAGAGIRVEGNNNRVTIAEGVTVAATGENVMDIMDGANVIETLSGNGVGVLLTHGTGSVFTNYGRIDAGPGEYGIGGENGIGIWINSNATTVVNHGVISATGTGGIGVRITATGVSGAYTGRFLNQGRIDSGPGGTGIYIERLVGENTAARLDNAGIINAGEGNNAIYIDGQGTIGTWTTLPVLHGINLMEGTTIVGNIDSTSFNWQVLTFGRKAGADGFAEFDSVNNTYFSGGNSEDFEIRIYGNVLGVYDMETWGGTTYIGQDLTSPGGWLYIGRGELTSTLILRGDIDGLEHATVLGSGTLIAGGVDTGGIDDGTTFNLNYVHVHSGGVLSPSVDEAGVGRLTLQPLANFVFGYSNFFRMEDGSTLRVDLAANDNSDRIIVVGQNNVDPETGNIIAYNTSIGAITIDLTTVSSGMFTLIQAQTPGTMQYTPESVVNTIITFNGSEITDFGRKVADVRVYNGADTALVLESIILNTGNDGNYHLTWTGLDDGTTWEIKDNTADPDAPENWRDDAGFSVWFEDGDAVTFGLGGENTITITPANVFVGDMRVIGEGDWVFNGNITGIVTQITDISDGTVEESTGGLTMEGTGTITLNGINTFVGDIMLDGGVKIVDDIIFSRTIVNGISVLGTPHTLATDSTLYVGTDGYAELNLLNGGEARAANGVYIGGGTIDSYGIIAVGAGSTLTTNTVHVGGDNTEPRGTGMLSGSGSVHAGNVNIYATGILYAGEGLDDFGTLTLSTSLRMEDESTLMVNLGLGNQSNRVAVGTTADIGEININLTKLFQDYQLLTGTYTLVTAGGSLSYAPGSATILLNGEEIPYVGRWRWFDITADAQATGNSLQLTIGGEETNVHLHWTGADMTRPNVWDLGSENWEGVGPTGDPIYHFMPGDIVSFALPSGTHNINLANDYSVADMFVSGSAHWIFSGGTIIGDAGSDATAFEDATGRLTISMTGGGTVTLLNHAEFLGGEEFPGGIEVLSGRLNVGDGGDTGSIAGDIYIATGANVTFYHSAGTNLAFENDISGGGSLTKRGESALALLGNNTYTGLTTIELGRLTFGSQENSIGAVTIRNGGILSGIGAETDIDVAGTVNNMSSVIQSFGNLSVSGILNNNTGAIYDFTGAVRADEIHNLDGIILGVEGEEGYTSEVHAEFLNNRGMIGQLKELTADRVENTGGLMTDIENISIAGKLDNMTAEAAIVNIGNLEAGSLRNEGGINGVGTMTIEGEVHNYNWIGNIGTMKVGGDLTNDEFIGNIESLSVEGSVYNTNTFVNVKNMNIGTPLSEGGVPQVFMNQYGAVFGGIGHINMNGGTFLNPGGVIIVGETGVNASGEAFFKSIGTLSIDGNLNNDGGVFYIGLNDRSNDTQKNSVIEVSGTAVINGGYVHIIVERDQNYVATDSDYRYVFLTAGELDVERPFDMATVNDPLLKPTGRYDDSQYWFFLERAFLYSGEGETQNQRALGRYIDMVGIYPNDDWRGVLMALDHARGGYADPFAEGVSAFSSMSTTTDEASAAPTPTPTIFAGHGDPVARALDQMSGSIYGTVTTVAFQNTVMFHAALTNVLRRDYNDVGGVYDQLYRGQPGLQRPILQRPIYGNRGIYNPTNNVWGMLYGNTGIMQSDGNTGKYNQGFFGLLAGFDRINERRARMGVFLSMGEGSLSGELQDRMLSKEIMAGHYHRRDGEQGYLLLQLGVGVNRYDTERRMAFGGYNGAEEEVYYVDRTAKNSYNAFLATIHLETGLRYRGGILNLSPFVAGQYSGLLREGFTERGAGSLNLTTEAQTYHSFRAMFGMRFDTEAIRYERGLVSFYGNAAWMYEFEPSDKYSKFEARFSNAGLLSGTPSFTVHGNNPGRDWVQAGFGVKYDIHAHLRAFIGYDAYVNMNQVIHAGGMGVVWEL